MIEQILVVDEQLGESINDAQNNTLRVSDYGGGNVALCVTGIAEFTGSGSNHAILTIMTADECLGFIRMLLDICKRSRSNSVEDTDDEWPKYPFPFGDYQ